MAKVQIETTQNVLLDFELSDIGDRIGAALIDELIKGAYTILMYLIIVNFIASDFFDSPETSFIALQFFLSIPIIFYYPAFEYLWNGQTPGKKKMKLKVVRADGKKTTLGDYIIRFLFRTIDTQGAFLIAIMLMDTIGQIVMLLLFLFLIPVPIIGILTISFTKKKQRVGDLLAGTLVVKLKQRVSLEDTILLTSNDNYTPKIANVLELSDRDIRIIKEALDLYKKNNDPKHVRILAKKTKELLQIKQNVKPIPLLKTVLKDYNHLAIKKDDLIN